MLLKTSNFKVLFVLNIFSCFTEKEFIRRKFDKYCNREKVLKLEGFSLMMEELGVTEGYKDLFR